jgi:co-chaperonin GroES (HSP10)
MIQPLDNKLLISVHPKETETITGILLLNKSKKEAPRFGTVIAIGDKVFDVKVGDTVSFGNYALREPLDDYFLMSIDDLFGYFKN